MACYVVCVFRDQTQKIKPAFILAPGCKHTHTRARDNNSRYATVQSGREKFTPAHAARGAEKPCTLVPRPNTTAAAACLSVYGDAAPPGCRNGWVSASDCAELDCCPAAAEPPLLLLLFNVFRLPLVGSG